jgi:hypothetical protein
VPGLPSWTLSTTTSRMKLTHSTTEKKLETLHESCSRSTRKPSDQDHSPFPRTVNLPDITFTDEEQKLLDLGLHFSIQKPTPSTWTNLMAESERAIKLLYDKLQDPLRLTAAKKMKQLYNCNPYNHTYKRQWHVLKQIRQKITNNSAMITQADKGKTIVILYTHDYNEKSSLSYLAIISIP